MRWTSDEKDYILNNYTDEEQSIIEGNLPGRTWTAIKLQANKLKVYRSFKFKRNSIASILLDNSLQSSYWIGFILADGHIENNKRLTVTLAEKDVKHLIELQKYLTVPNLLKSVKKGANETLYASNILSIQDVDTIPKVARLYQINSNKTKKPPNMSLYSLTDEQLLALIVGFIDGDGNLNKLQNRPDYNLRIKCDATWLDNLKFIEDTLYRVFPYDKKVKQLTKINSAGYAQLVISNNKIIHDLVGFIKEHNLYVLARKWPI